MLSNRPPARASVSISRVCKGAHCPPMEAAELTVEDREWWPEDEAEWWPELEEERWPDMEEVLLWAGSGGEPRPSPHPSPPVRGSLQH